MNQAKWDDAITALTEAIRLDPKSVAAYSTRGLAYTMKDNFPAALADFDAATENRSQQRGGPFQPRLRLLPQGRPRQGPRRLLGNHPPRSEKCQRLPRPRLIKTLQPSTTAVIGLNKAIPRTQNEGLCQPRHDLSQLDNWENSVADFNQRQ